MTERPKFFDDLAGVAGGALSALAGLREEVTAMVRARVDEAVRRMDLVKRDEFEAMAELARRAAARSESLEARVLALETPTVAPASAEEAGAAAAATTSAAATVVPASAEIPPEPEEPSAQLP
jgi:BMFP domain-containing protein YqiC